MPQDTHAWHLDKRIPIATLFAIACQAVALGWMASSMDSRISELERFRKEITDARVVERIAIEEVRSADTEKKFAALEKHLEKIDDKLDSIADRLGVRRKQ